jgi:DNA mismatch repair protein MutL
MSKIRILPEHLANRIAAGEVVERPASVVKELLENSLDAGADRIEVEVEGGGTRLIRIIDNGEGMDEDDILLSLERHGTSKIQDDRDLDAITTLGFRGEAIPSIGSVAKMVIHSRPKDRDLGSRVVSDFGKLVKVHETGCGYGTVIEVRNLFGNTPARRKFLRTVRTELGHIDEVVKNSALASPKVSFILRIDGKETLHLDGALPLDKRLAAIMHYRGAFMEVGAPSLKSGTRFVHGFLVPPEAQVAISSGLRLFVNGRVIKDRMMTHAVAEGMRGFLMKGRNPAGLLHLHLPADEVDVNVHPAKHEVRFRSSHDVHELISRFVQQALHGLQGAIRDDVFLPPAKTEASPAFRDRLPTSSTLSVQREKKENFRPQPVQYPRRPHSDLDRIPAVEEPSPVFDRLGRTKFPPPSTTEEAEEHTGKAPLVRGPGKKHGLEVLGRFLDLYVFCRSGDTLVVIDQHAAHERLLFERLKKQFLNGRIAAQNLLFAQTVELSRFQSQLVERNREEIERLGFSIREFGGNTHIISAVPALAGQCDPGRLFIDILDRFGSENEKGQGAGRLEDILADMACKAAVRSGDRLSLEEIDALLNQMAEADLFSHCPHGRPVIKSFRADEIKKWFYRP